MDFGTLKIKPYKVTAWNYLIFKNLTRPYGKNYGVAVSHFM
jgi:hypothetical protein